MCLVTLNNLSIVNFRLAQKRPPLTDKINYTTSLNLDLIGFDGSKEAMDYYSSPSTTNT